MQAFFMSCLNDWPVSSSFAFTPPLFKISIFQHVQLIESTATNQLAVVQTYLLNVRLSQNSNSLSEIHYRN